MVRRLCLILAPLCLGAVCQGCASGPARVTTAAAPPAGYGMTFVADGSGDLRQVSDKLANVAKEERAAMVVERVQWSHGKGAVFPDLYDAEHHQAQGKALAQQIITFRTEHPTSRICLIGYSSGASVALAAAEQVPPGTVDRVILLSPSVAARHDLRPTLRASREGIDTFNSERDAICLSLYALGTGDGVGQAVAGRSGFEPICERAEDHQLYKGLRQHFWQGGEQWAGHNGGHFGCFNGEFLRVQVLPRLLGRQ